MKHELPAYLRDIVTACHNIRAFTEECTATSYAENLLVKSATERQFVIIGEALRRIEREFPNDFAQIRNGRRIISFRNILAHGYDVISDATVWSIVQDRLDELIEDCETLQK